MDRNPIVEMTGIVKTFPGVVANDGVNFKVYPGEIHALLGENGAGKSTLMSILAGLYQPDAGVIRVKGREVVLRSPQDALTHGVGMVHQHFKLVSAFSVAENIVLGAEPGGFRLNRRKIEAEMAALAESYRLKVPVSAVVGKLSLAEQQRVEILKLLYRQSELLILDEPTTVLTPEEIRELFVVLRSMADQGKGIIIITHKLNEVMDLADYVTVMRHGKVVGYGAIAEMNESRLAQMMVGREVLMEVDKKPQSPGETIIRLENVSAVSDRGYLALKDVSLQVREGEIVGIAGVSGSGQKELSEVMTGLRMSQKGRVLVGKEDVTGAGALTFKKMGISLIPEDRLGMGLVPGMGVADNVILRSYREPHFGSGSLIDYRKVEKHARELVKRFGIDVSDYDRPVSMLSGGNLQRLILARELSGHPRLIVAAYPVRGLDVAATETVYSMLVKERDRGAGVVLILEDLDDLLKFSDRIVVLFNGMVTGVVDAGKASKEMIGAMMLGAKEATA